MRRFAALYEELDASTATGDKLAALQRYLAQVEPADAAWAVYVLAGGRPRQAVPTALIRQVASEMAGLDDWLFEACYHAVGDLAETVAHVLPVGSQVGVVAGAAAEVATAVAGPERPAASAAAPGVPPDLEDEPTPAEPAAPPVPGRGQADTLPWAHAGLAAWMEQRVLTWRALPPPAQAQALREAFAQLDAPGRFVLVKLIGGGWRVGVSRLLVQRALAAHAGLDARLVAERMMGYTDARTMPTPAAYLTLLQPAAAGPARGGQPYPFFLAHPLDGDVAALGPVQDWLLEWKYDGIRAQLVRRDGGTWLWSRGEELLEGRFPEVEARAAALPDGTVLDGELLAWHDGDPQPAPFHRLQQRIGRRTLTRKVLQEVPVRFLAYDLLEEGGLDLRALPQARRRERLEALLAEGPLDLSPRLQPASWAEAAAWRERSRERGVEGLMLKQVQSRYGAGRTRGDGVWWKWKVDPLTVDGVLIYAQAGHGRRASVYTDYTFAVWNRPPCDAAEAQAVVDAIARREPARDGALQLVPFAKAYSGLTDAEFARVSRVVRDTTLEKFGPVRSVRPTLVFELGFEGVQPSPRHRSGLAVRFPRMLRLRDDKPLWQADTLQVLQAMIAEPASPGR